jgi:hypothetical protein
MGRGANRPDRLKRSIGAPGLLYADLVGTDQSPHTPRWLVWAGPTFCFVFSLFFGFFLFFSAFSFYVF